MDKMLLYAALLIVCIFLGCVSYALLCSPRLACKVASIILSCICLMMLSIPVIYEAHTNRQLEEDGRIVTVTAQTNLAPAGHYVSAGDHVEIDFVTPVNPVSVGDVVSFYDTNGCPQVGIVNSINDDNTATIFMNDYAANGTVSVPMQYIYGIVTGRHYG